MPGDAHISPTAHYTSYVWYANGMSHPALISPRGRTFYRMLQPANAAYLLLSPSANLEQGLLARHRIIDHLLDEAIRSGRVGQVVEIASGLSPRGYRFARRYPDLIYVEGDLPDMAAHKRAALEGAGLVGPRHHVTVINALADEGPQSLASESKRLLDPTRGTAIITEGLIGYFDLDAVHGMWRRFASVLRGYPRGLYLADLFDGGETAGPAVRGFQALLGAFTRRQVFAHYAQGDEVLGAARAAGFADARVHEPREYRDVLALPGVERGQVVRILEGIS